MADKDNVLHKSAVNPRPLVGREVRGIERKNLPQLVGEMSEKDQRAFWIWTYRNNWEGTPDNAESAIAAWRAGKTIDEWADERWPPGKAQP